VAKIGRARGFSNYRQAVRTRTALGSYFAG
jgi:hypothetical protein